MKIKNSIQSVIYRFVIQFWNLFRRATLVALLFLPKLELHAETFNVKALWVVRDYMVTPEKIDEIIRFAEDNYYNHLFVQIR